MGTTKAQRTTKGAPKKVTLRTRSGRAARRARRNALTEAHKANRIRWEAKKADRNGRVYKAPGWTIIVGSSTIFVTRAVPKKP